MESSNTSLIHAISKAVQQEIAPLIAKQEESDRRMVHLESLIKDTMDMSKGEIDMPKRYRYQVTLPTGETVWLSGNSPDEAFQNGLKKYGMESKAEPKKPTNTAPTIDEYGECWFKVYHEPHVKPNWASNTRIYLDKHIYPFFGGKALDEITFDDVQAFFNSKQHLAHSTVEKLKITLNGIFKNAVEDGIVSRNIINSDRYRISKRVTERIPLTVEQANHILEQLPKLKEADQSFIMIPLYTGARRSEALGLLWSDIDFESNLVHIRRAVTFTGNQPVIGGTKSEKGKRDVPLLPQLKDFLMTLPDKQGYVLGGKNKPITESTFQRTWERIDRTIDLQGATAHIFRHTYSTIAAPYTDPKTLQAMMGHSDIKTTMNVYTHAQARRIQAAVEDLRDMYAIG